MKFSLRFQKDEGKGTSDRMGRLGWGEPGVRNASSLRSVYCE